MVLDDTCPIGPVEWAALVAEAGFLALGRNRYHCQYVCYTDGTYYYAENGATGQLDFGGPNNRGTPSVSGTDGLAVIVAAIGGLTAGRTWQEKIVVKGNFSFTGPLNVPGYTILDFSNAKITLAANSDSNVIQTLAAATDISIIGGVIDCNGANQALGHGIYFQTTSNSELIGTTVFSANDHNIVLDTCTNVVLENVYSHSASLDGIAITFGSRNRIENSYFSANTTYGMLMFDSTDNIVDHCHFYNNTVHGIRLNKDANRNVFIAPHVDTVTGGGGRGIFLDASDSGLGAGGNVGNIFIAPVVRNCADRGVWLYSIAGAGNANSENVFISPRIELNGANSGIDFSTFSTYNEILGGVVKNNVGYGIFITGTGHKVIGVQSYDDQGVKTQTHGIWVNSDDNHQIETNNVAGNLTAGMSVAGYTTTNVRDNIGWVTENNGTATMANGTAAIVVAHGLDGTPTVFSWAGEHAEVSALYVSAIGAANFTFNKGTAGNTTGNRDINWEAKVR